MTSNCKVKKQQPSPIDMREMLQELEETGTIRPYDKERESRELQERIDKLNQTK